MCSNEENSCARSGTNSDTNTAVDQFQVRQLAILRRTGDYTLGL
jgi:hypothetical protein